MFVRSFVRLLFFIHILFPYFSAIRDHLMEEETLAEIANLLGTSEIIMCKVSTYNYFK